MEIKFKAIGLDVPNQNALYLLAENAGNQGEVSTLARKSGTLHGRCWKLGSGLEVWTLLYELSSGETFLADCRPAFRSSSIHQISPWVMTEFHEDGEAVIHGFLEHSGKEVLFQLQNLTEFSPKPFYQQTLSVSLCGLAHQAEILPSKQNYLWESLKEKLPDSNYKDFDWAFCGKILKFHSIQNPISGENLSWIYLDLKDFKLEILINPDILQGNQPKIGSFLKGVIWLQGHLLPNLIRQSSEEGFDGNFSVADFWKHLQRKN